MAIIVLDPGHGGDTNLVGSSANNAVGPAGTLEKNLTLDVATRLGALMTSRGHTVHMTRTTDVNVSAENRARLASSVGAAVFLSIHFNAFADATVQGTETLVRPLGGGTGLAAVDALSRTLATDIQAALVASLGHRDRGLVAGRYAVLSDAYHVATTARCLAEVSFLTDAAEERRLMTSAYLDQIAGALCHGLDNNLAVRFGARAQGRIAVGGSGWSPGRSHHDPDSYGRPRLHALSGDDDGEGAEHDAGEPIATVQNNGSQDDSHCPENSRTTASTAHFNLSEFRCRDGTDCPERFRGHLQELMENLEVLRTELGSRPININSGYRTPSYNASIGGASRSKHMCGMAADFTVSGVALSDVYDTIERLIAAGRMRQGGLSQYRTFIHYDVRGTRARWSGG